MGQILHGSATTTHANRAAIQLSKAPLKDLAARHALNQKTVSKWRKRTFVHDAPMGPKIDGYNLAKRLKTLRGLTRPSVQLG